MERRQHRRVRLRLPARIRWTTPFGQRIELRETLDVSRGGLLIPSATPAQPGAHVWVTFPYDASIPDGQPELPGRVVRADPHADGEQRFAIHFEAIAFLPPRNDNAWPDSLERRRAPRRSLAVPVRVRPEYLPWFEEAMTLDVSSDGLRFLSTREYALGAHLMISFSSASPSPWPGVIVWSAAVRCLDSGGVHRTPETGARRRFVGGPSSGSACGEFPTLVVHAEPEPGGTALAIAVRHLSK